MVALEAISIGLSVILTDVGAIHTIVRNGENGYPMSRPPTLRSMWPSMTKR